MEIKYIGIKELVVDNPLLPDYIPLVTNHYISKISKLIKIETLKIQVKRASKQGQSHRYTINIGLIADKTILNAQETDWDINKVLHKAFKDIETQVIKKFSKH